MKKYLFIGGVEYSAHCLRALLEMNINIVDIMCPYREVSSTNSDYFDLGEVACEFGKEAYYFKRIKDETEHIRQCNPDIIFVLGLSQIVPQAILDLPTIGAIGSHPTLLPANRGRHPIIWAIANGLKKSGITLFWLDSGVDSGSIWAQEEFEIDMEDDAASVYRKIKNLSVKMLGENIADIEKGVIRKTEQDHTKATYWRKRGRKDGEIDWRMGSKRICDLVRALTSPYLGADCLYKGKYVKIWKVKPSEVIEELDGFINIEPGKIISTNGRTICVKTGDGLINIIEHEFDLIPVEGEYL